MNFDAIHKVYFLGIGGIGMSALARYFHAKGKLVAGYDKTSTPLTQELEGLGIDIHYKDDIQQIPQQCLNKVDTLVVWTPAVPASHSELQFLQGKGFEIKKRAEVLGIISNAKKGIAVAGTHGKTSVSTLTSHLLSNSGISCSAFLGGISKNLKSNLMIGDSEEVVVEADEFDRSFLHLKPWLALVTTIDEDHLDIYSGKEDIQNTFQHFVSQTQGGGSVVLKQGIRLSVPNGVNAYTYSLEDASSDFHATNITLNEGTYSFDVVTPFGKESGFRVFLPGLTNVENAVAAIALSTLAGLELSNIKTALSSYEGVQRRFDLRFNRNGKIYIDDYAHHPRELDAVIGSVRQLFPDKKITGIFQPHLYSRTRDFGDDFAQSLSKLDQLLLLDIYPARELPIEGITSQWLYEKIDMEAKVTCSKENLLHKIKGLNIEVLLTLGAGDIGQFVAPVTQLFENDEIA